MAAAAIIERISRAISSSSLQVLPDLSESVSIDTIGDLLRPWSELYPGVDPPEAGDVSRSVFGYKGLRRPRFIPRRRASCRPLPPPRRIAAPPKLVSPGLFASVSGIWDWYQQENSADQTLLQQPINSDGFVAFLAALERKLDDYYPLNCWLETSYRDNEPLEVESLELMLPHFTYDDPGAGVVEAFLSGAHGVTWLLEHHLQDADIELYEKDKDLVGETGFGKLVQTYAAHQGKKDYDLEALDDHGAYYFDEVWNKYPQYSSHIFDIITHDSSQNCSVSIISVDSINFAIDYWNAFDLVCQKMPPLEDFAYNTDGVAEMFIHEVCNVWRKEQGKKRITWTSPKMQAASAGKVAVRI